MTPQAKLQATLAQTGIPAKEIKVYGSQIVITCWSRDAADKWASLVSRFAKVRGVVESIDYDKKNKNTVLRPTSHKVWLMGAVIQ